MALEDGEPTPDADRARRWIDAGEPPPAEELTRPHAALRLARALKDACYAAWSTEPARAGSAADAAASLAGMGATLDLPPREQQEITALSHWTIAIAALGQGRLPAVIEHLDAAHDHFAAIGHAAEAAQTRVPRIVALNLLDRFADAVACAIDATARFIALGDARSAAKVSLNLGSLYLRRDDYAGAARHYREAATLFARLDDHEHSVMVAIGVGDALTARGAFAEAHREFDRARARARAHGLRVLEAMVDESVALLGLAQGDFQAALAGLERARRAYAALLMPQHAAIAEKQLGDAYLELGLLREAIALHEASLQAFEALQMPLERAWSLAALGRAQALTGQWDRADASFQSAAGIFHEQGSGVGEGVVQLARAQMSLGRQGAPADAMALAQAASASFRAAGFVNGAARAALTLAEAMLAAGDGEGAARAFDDVLAQARAVQLRAVEVGALTGLGLAALHRHDEPRAQAALTAAIGLFEEQRAALPGDDLQHAFLRDHLRPYEALLGLALRAHRLQPGPDRAQAVLQALERFRARALDLRLARGHADAGEVSPAVAELRARLNWLARRLQRLEQDGDPTGSLEATRRQVERELLEQVRRESLVVAPGARGRADDPARAPGAPHPAGPDGGLPRPDSPTGDPFILGLAVDDAAVAFGRSEGVYFACVVRAGGVEVVQSVAPAQAVDDAVRAVRFQVDALRVGATSLAAHMPQLTRRALAALGRVHDLLWRPLGGALATARRVMVVAPASLAGLPFSALCDGDRMLGERFEFCQSPSLALAVRLRARARPAALRGLVLGDDARLAHAGAEARAVGAALPEALTLVDAEATLAALARHAPAATVLHLACHGEFRADNPMFSALHLHDGPLTAEAVERLRLQPGLVVLSACDTAIGDAAPGDEHLGLVRAFFVAGAARVLASLWPVDDGVTAAFMARFYGALGDGLEPGAALRRAQAELRAVHPHPYHWAAFTLYGGW